MGYAINYNVKGSRKDKTNASDTAVVTKNEATDGLVPFQGHLEFVSQNFGGKQEAQNLMSEFHGGVLVDGDSRNAIAITWAEG